MCYFTFWSRVGEKLFLRVLLYTQHFFCCPQCIHSYSGFMLNLHLCGWRLKHFYFNPTPKFQERQRTVHGVGDNGAFSGH